MQLAHALARGATAPIRLGLSAGGLGLSVARTVVEEARRALGHDRDRPRANAWSGARPAPVRSPASQAPTDGVGAEIHVDPPWAGYDAMTAAQIRQRLASADSGLAAAVSLYEGAGRGRVSVVGAADRRLRSLDS